MSILSQPFRTLCVLGLLAQASSSLVACSSSDDPKGHAGASGSAGAGADHGSTNGGADNSDDSGEGGDSASAAPEPAEHVFSINFDYRFDRAGFFDRPERRAALEAAAATWSARLTNDFLRVPA